jgi:hypothetical protein
LQVSWPELIADAAEDLDVVDQDGRGLLVLGGCRRSPAIQSASESKTDFLVVKLVMRRRCGAKVIRLF